MPARVVAMISKSASMHGLTQTIARAIMDATQRLQQAARRYQRRLPT